MAESRPAISEPGSHRTVILDRAAWIRRADVNLRSKYPNLVTRIFETAPHQFVITFDQALQDASRIDFEQIRPVTLQARISNEIPAAYLREIPPLGDDELARNFEGFPFNRIDLFNLVVGRFPEVPIVTIQDGGSPMTITVELGHAISATQQAALLGFCRGLGTPAPFELKVTGSPLKVGSRSNDALFIGASRLRPSVPPFVREDEAFWFDNLDRIYAGRIRVDEIPGIQEDDSRCFVDATIGTHVNLRQLLALYDTIYISPPLRTEHDEFLRKQALTEADLLALGLKPNKAIVA